MFFKAHRSVYMSCVTFGKTGTDTRSTTHTRTRTRFDLSDHRTDFSVEMQSQRPNLSELASFFPVLFSSQGSAEATAPGAQVLTFQVTPSDYLLGVADLTGELMRMCISSVGNGDIDTPFQLSQFLRQIHDGFSYIGNTGPYEVSKKLHTLRQSMGKVEDACYTLRVRGSEIPKHMLADVFSSRTTLMDPEEGVV